MNRYISTHRRAWLAAIATLVAVAVFTLSARQAAPDPQAAVNAAFNKYKTLKEGKNADYIPALAKVSPDLFGLALYTADGKVYTAGDITTEVSIQSISKVFTMAQVINEQGPDAIEKRIGVDATGLRFNSIVAVEIAQKALGGPELNPLVNPGAITTTCFVTVATSASLTLKPIAAHNRRTPKVRGPRWPERPRCATSATDCWLTLGTSRSPVTLSSMCTRMR